MSRGDHDWSVAAGRPGIEPISYWEPRHTMPSAWREHAAFGYWLIDAARPDTLVELGTHNGFSFFVFAEAVRRLGLPTRLVAIDTWEGDDQAGYYSEEVYDSVARISAEDYAESTELIRGYFADAATRFDDGSIDLLHIDGRHGYEDVREDFKLYLPKLSDRAVVVFHDTRELQEGFGVHRFWAEISDAAPSFEFHHGHGLGVLAWGAHAPDRVLDFLDESTRHPQPIRDFFSSRGAVVSARIAADESRVNLDLESAHLRSELLAYNALVESGRRELQEANSRLSRVERSMVWRVSAPFRGIRRLFERRA